MLHEENGGAKFSKKEGLKKCGVELLWATSEWKWSCSSRNGGRTRVEDEPVCRTCKKSVRAKSGNTYNLLAHLQDHHADLYAEASKGVQSKGIFVELLFHCNVHLVLVDTL